MTSPLPWVEIKSPQQGYRRRVASSATVVPVSWAKNPQSQNLLIIELEGDNSARFKKMDLSVRGMTIDLRLIDGVQMIVITLEEQVNADLFHSFCKSLINALEQASDPASALGITGTQIVRWRAFLSGKKSRKLSDEEIRGLFAELWVLRQLNRHISNPVEAVSSWCGPDKVHQDFIFRDRAIETKALSGRERNAVRISSEDQLESLSDHLFLSVLRLVTSDGETAHAHSLNELVRIVRSEISAVEAIDDLDRKLSAVGYFELPDYDEPEFIVADQLSYRVEDGFPRLVRSQLPDGIARVSYEIQLEDIESFKCNEMEVWT